MLVDPLLRHYQRVYNAKPSPEILSCFRGRARPARPPNLAREPRQNRGRPQSSSSLSRIGRPHCSPAGASGGCFTGVNHGTAFAGLQRGVSFSCADLRQEMDNGFNRSASRGDGDSAEATYQRATAMFEEYQLQRTASYCGFQGPSASRGTVGSFSSGVRKNEEQQVPKKCQPMVSLSIYPGAKEKSFSSWDLKIEPEAKANHYANLHHQPQRTLGQSGKFSRSSIALNGPLQLSAQTSKFARNVQSGHESRPRLQQTPVSRTPQAGLKESYQLSLDAEWKDFAESPESVSARIDAFLREVKHQEALLNESLARQAQRQQEVDYGKRLPRSRTRSRNQLPTTSLKGNHDHAVLIRNKLDARERHHSPRSFKGPARNRSTSVPVERTMTHPQQHQQVRNQQRRRQRSDEPPKVKPEPKPVDVTKVRSKLRTDRNYQPPKKLREERPWKTPEKDGAATPAQEATGFTTVPEPEDVHRRDDSNEDADGEDQEEHDEDEDEIVDKNFAWIYDQAIRGWARQRAASKLKTVLQRSNESNLEKESSKDSAYGFSGGETSRLQTREPTPDTASTAAKVATSGNTKGGRRQPYRHPSRISNDLINHRKKTRDQQVRTLKSRVQGSSPVSNRTTIKQRLGEVNRSKSSQARSTAAAASAYLNILPNKVKMFENGRLGSTSVVPGEKDELDVLRFLNKLSSEIIRQGLYTEKGIRRALDNFLALDDSAKAISAIQRERLMDKLKEDLGLQQRQKASSLHNRNPSKRVVVASEDDNRSDHQSRNVGIYRFDEAKHILMEEADFQDSSVEEILKIVYSDRKGRKASASNDANDMSKDTGLNISDMNVSFNSSSAKQIRQEGQHRGLLVKSFGIPKNDQCGSPVKNGGMEAICQEAAKPDDEDSSKSSISYSSGEDFESQDN